MAVTYWEGDTDGDWMTDTNWSGVHPAADDVAIFDGRCGATGSEPDEGLLDSESGHVDHATLDLLHVKDSYSQGMATAAEPCCTSPDTLIIEGSGTYYFLCGVTDQSSDTTIATTIINNPDAIVYLYSNCNDGANAASYTNIYVLAGIVYLAYYSVDTADQGTAVGNMYIAPRDNRSSNATVTAEKDAYNVLTSTAMNVYMQNGTFTTDSQLGTIHLHDGTLNYGTDLAAAPEADLNITFLRQTGGTFNWYPDDSGTPTITAAWVTNGTFDASGTTNADRAKTITTLRMFNSATVSLDNNKSNITVTNLYKHGGTLNYDSGSKAAITYNQP